MYNRYVPQPDGSFRKNTQPEPQKKTVQQPGGTGGKRAPPPPPEQKTVRPPVYKESAGIWKELLPKNLNSEDLLIMSLLLLLSRESGEGKEHALIALAIYLFL